MTALILNEVLVIVARSCLKHPKSATDIKVLTILDGVVLSRCYLTNVRKSSEEIQVLCHLGHWLLDCFIVLILMMIFRAHVDTCRSFMTDKMSSLLGLSRAGEVNYSRVLIVAGHGW